MSEGFSPRRASPGKLRRRLANFDLDLPIEQQREGFARLLALTEIAMPDHALERVEIAGVEALWIDASGSPEREPIVHLHGGGYSLGSPETHRPLAARLSRQLGAPVLLPRYRQPPEHPCPAALTDVLRFWRGLPESSTRVLSGDSAGGGLALTLAMALRDAGERLPTRMVLMSPWTDLEMASTPSSIDRQSAVDGLFQRAGLEWMARQYAGGLDRRDPRVSPLWAELGGLPAMLIQAGGEEALLDDSTRLAQRVLAAGGQVEVQVWPDQGHVFQATPMLSAAAEAIESIGRWLE